MALRLACHDAGDASHASRRRASRRARSSTRSSRRASRRSARARMPGMAGNLAAMLEDRYHRGTYAEITDRADAPLRGRRRPDGARAADRAEPPPAAAQAGRSLAPVDRGQGRRRPRQARRRRSRTSAPSPRRPRRCCADLDMADERRDRSATRPRTTTSDEQNRERRSRRATASPRSSDGAERAPRSEQSDEASDDEEDGRCEAAEAPTGDMPDEDDEATADEAAESLAPADAGAQRAARARLQGLHAPSSTRSIDAEELCDAEELGRLRAYLDKQLAHLQGVVGAPRQPAAAPPDGAAEPRLGVRPRRGHARCRAPDARRHRPDAAAVLQAREGHRFPRHRRDAADRQFRLDARPADHGRGDLRRHPRPHARALRRQGRDPGLHHPRLEGRPVRARPGSQAGKPANPGRLNDLRHIIYKSADAPWRRARTQPRPDDARGPAQGEHRRRGARLGAQAPARRGPSSAAS